MKVNERLLAAYTTRQVPHSDILKMIKGIEETSGEERLNFQNRVAEEIEKKYPLREMPIHAPKG